MNDSEQLELSVFVLELQTMEQNAKMFLQKVQQMKAMEMRASTEDVLFESSFLKS